MTSLSSSLFMQYYLSINLIKQNQIYYMSNRKERKPLPYSPSSYTTMKEQGSPSKASILLQDDHSQYIEELLAKRDNFCTCLDLYKVSYENELPQKCLFHNNFITLYCQNEFKLLCVNCIYGTAIHKDHRVVPSKNSIPNISRDNEDNIKTLEEELSRIRYVETEMVKNKKIYEDEYKAIMKQVDDEFKEIYAMIEQKHHQSRNRVMEVFNKVTSQNEIGIKEISWWKELLVKTRQTLPKASLHEQTEIYKHLVLDLFLQQKIDEEKLTYIPSAQQIRFEFLKQVIDLREMIQSNLGASYQTQKPRGRVY